MKRRWAVSMRYIYLAVKKITSLARGPFVRRTFTQPDRDGNNAPIYYLFLPTLS